MKKAIYYNEGSEKQLCVAKEHADGTVDLVAEEGGAVVVEKCPIASKTGQVGYCSVEGMISKDAKAAKVAAASATETAREAKADAADAAREAAAAERAAERKHNR